jgi:hypothetical protein
VSNVLILYVHYISAAMFSDLSHFVFLLIKYSSLLKSLLEVEIHGLSKFFSEIFSTWYQSQSSEVQHTRDLALVLQ